MPNYNKVMLMGHLTRDPDMRHVPSGDAVASFGLAVSRKRKDKEDETCFVDLTAFGRQAETIGQYLKKGSAGFFEGRLVLDQWVDRDGAKRSKLKVIVDTFQFVGGKQDGGQQRRRDEPDEHPGYAPDDGEIPF